MCFGFPNLWAVLTLRSCLSPDRLNHGDEESASFASMTAMTGRWNRPRFFRTWRRHPFSIPSFIAERTAKFRARYRKVKSRTTSIPSSIRNSDSLRVMISFRCTHCYSRIQSIAVGGSMMRGRMREGCRWFSRKFLLRRELEVQPR
jgi:hypothetical protein